MANKKSPSRAKSQPNKTSLYLAIVIAVILALLVALSFSPVGDAIIEYIGIDSSSGSDSSIGSGSSIGSDSSSSNSGDLNVLRLGGNVTANEQVILEDVVFKAHFIDVGQGDAVLLEFKDGLTVMIDAGSTSSGLSTIRADFLAYLATLSLEDIDYLIVTHPDTDHYNMLTAVLDAYDVKNIIYNDCEKNTTYSNFIARIDEEVSGEHNISIDTDGFDYKITGDYCTINVYAPGYARFEDGNGEYDASESNGMSPIITVECADRKLLLTGDAVSATTEPWFMEKLGETAYDVDFIKIGHHGSDTSSSAEFLDYITAEYAIISCDDSTKHGHPDIEVMNRLYDRGIVTYRTNRHGNIALYIDLDGDFAFEVENEVPVDNNKNLINDHMLITD